MMRPFKDPGRISRIAGSYSVDVVRAALPHLDRRSIAVRLAYASFVSIPHKLLYLETPKAACTTIKMLLRDLCDAPPIRYLFAPDDLPLHETRRDMFIHVRSNVPLPSLLDLDDRTQKEVLTSPEYFRFAIVRNPYTRVVSAWRNKVLYCEPGYEYIYEDVFGTSPPLDAKQFVSFKQFMDVITHERNLDDCNPHWRRQAALLFMPGIQYTHIGKLEKLPDTLRLLKSHIGSAIATDMEGRNTSSSEAAPNAMAPELAAQIFSLYEQDFEIFEYARDSWRNLRMSTNVPAEVRSERMHDELIERNLIISYLYREYASAYRFSLTRVRDIFRGRLRR